MCLAILKLVLRLKVLQVSPLLASGVPFVPYLFTDPGKKRSRVNIIFERLDCREFQ